MNESKSRARRQARKRAKRRKREEIRNDVLNRFPGFVYLIEAAGTGRYKVGVSRNPKRRRRSMQTGCPEFLMVIEKAQVPRPYEWEAKIHARLAEFHKHGEWYEIPKARVAQLRRGFQELRERYGTPDQTALPPHTMRKYKRMLKTSNYGGACTAKPLNHREEPKPETDGGDRMAASTVNTRDIKWRENLENVPLASQAIA